MTMRVRPFRGLRYAPSRVELGAVVAPSTSTDPRHVRALLDEVHKPDDGTRAPLRRARLRLAEWQRAGIVARDAQPAVYAVRRRDDDGGESLGMFCTLAVDGSGAATGVPAPAFGPSDEALEARFDVGVGVEPVVARFEEPRVRRALENAIDREADAAWKVGASQFELWCIDEESTTARVATLLTQAGVEVVAGEALLAAQAAWFKRTSATSGDDDAPRAGGHALAFLHPKDDAWPDVPIGAALAPLTGLLAPSLG